MLEAGGSSLEKIIKVNIYLTDMANFPKIIELRRRYFKPPYPADTIVEVGALGMGHTMKLINNFISIGNCAVIAEATATAAKLGVDMRKFCEVIQAGGANSRMFQMVMPWLLEGDDSHLKGPLRIAGKDMRFYTRLAEQAPAAAFIAQAVNQTLHLCNVRGHGDRFLPVLPGLLADLNGAKIHDL